MKLSISLIWISSPLKWNCHTLQQVIYWPKSHSESVLYTWNVLICRHNTKGYTLNHIKKILNQNIWHPCLVNTNPSPPLSRHQNPTPIYFSKCRTWYVRCMNVSNYSKMNLCETLKRFGKVITLSVKSCYYIIRSCLITLSVGQVYYIIGKVYYVIS